MKHPPARRRSRHSRFQVTLARMGVGWNAVDRLEAQQPHTKTGRITRKLVVKTGQKLFERYVMPRITK